MPTLMLLLLLPPPLLLPLLLPPPLLLLLLLPGVLLQGLRAAQPHQVEPPSSSGESHNSAAISSSGRQHVNIPSVMHNHSICWKQLGFSS
jgi:hypothetical protein